MAGERVRTGLWRYRALLPWDGGNDVTRYVFKVLAGKAQRWLAADGEHAHVPPEDVHFRVNRVHAPPAWVPEQIFYQVFVDRFARAGPPTDRRGEIVYGATARPVVQKQWGEPLEIRHASNTFYGGDLAGVSSRLDYLQHELGVTAIYLTPVFTAGSNHKYDSEDFAHVDPHLGGDAALIALREQTRKRGMRLLLDAVVNHTGTNHPWFNRWGQHATLGAYQSPDSPYRSWYVFDAAGQAWGWKGAASLPVLDFAAAGVRDAIYEGGDAVLRHWLRPPFAIDGWRLDVIHMLGEGTGARNNAHYVREFRRVIREENPQAYVLGEHFAEATRWLQGDQEDGAMNYYGFAQPLRAWLAGVDAIDQPITLSTAQVERWFTRARSVIPYDNQLAQLNLLDSHDTPRLLTLLQGDVARMKIAATLLFTYPGVPCIYYGDEIGTQGAGDPDCRRCFDWQRPNWNRSLFDHYAQLARMRRERAEWQRGAYLTLAMGDDWFAFARFSASQATIVAANRGSDVTVRIALSSLPIEGRDPADLGWHDEQGQSATIDGFHLVLQLAASSSAVVLSR